MSNVHGMNGNHIRSSSLYTDSFSVYVLVSPFMLVVSGQLLFEFMTHLVCVGKKNGRCVDNRETHSIRRLLQKKKITALSSPRSYWVTRYTYV